MTVPVAILALIAIIFVAIIVISVKLHRVSKNVADTVTWSGGGGGSLDDGQSTKPSTANRLEP
ncbi:hypothetical protein [Sphingomonas beigongshangi]|uniref:hypothetical protein n=1 Tax=Sphingomonas beigongshangi TaxID=2782540 RepID=UPI00193B23B5|nr:hypothetical protein [Sphingomonas beigongshangi]